MIGGEHGDMSPNLMIFKSYEGHIANKGPDLLRPLEVGPAKLLKAKLNTGSVHTQRTDAPHR